MNENAGPLSVFNPRNTQTDVTLQPRYAALLNAIQNHFPGSQVRIMDNRMDYGALKGNVRVLSVAVVVTEFADQVVQLPPTPMQHIYSPEERALRRHEGERFVKNMLPISAFLKFADFDFQSICITSPLKVLKSAPIPDPSLYIDQGAHTVNRLKGEVLFSRKSNGEVENWYTPYHQQEVPLFQAGQSRFSLQTPFAALEACNYTPDLSESGHKVMRFGFFDNMDLFYLRPDL